MSTQLDALKAQVQQTTSVTQSAVTLLQGLKQKLDDAIASGDTAQLQALSDELGADNAALAAAITANTPADNSGSGDGSSSGDGSGSENAEG